jgi:hypothetical protein
MGRKNALEPVSGQLKVLHAKSSDTEEAVETRERCELLR